jgi:hypothetical protein
MRRTRADFVSVSLTPPPEFAAPAVPQPLPETIPLDTNLSELIAIARSSLPLVDSPSPALMLATYVTTPSSVADNVTQAGIAAQSAVYPTGELTNRIETNSCASSSCGTAPGLFPTVEIRSEFNPDQYSRPDSISEGSYSADTSPGSSPSGGGEGAASAAAMSDYRAAESELSRAASDLSSANSELSSARSSYESAQRNLTNELDALRGEADRLNASTRARNAAASTRNDDAREANAAKQALHNAVTENNRIKQDIANQTTKKWNLDSRLVELEIELKKRSQDLSSDIPNIGAGERTDTLSREGNKGIENQAIDESQSFYGRRE